MVKSNELLPGTLDMLVLKAISVGSMHGYGILLRIQQMSKDVLQVEQGSLYPALNRLEHKGLVKSRWGVSENNRRAKFYTLTEAGHKYLRREAESWKTLSEAVGSVLEFLPEEGT